MCSISSHMRDSCAHWSDTGAHAKKAHGHISAYWWSSLAHACAHQSHNRAHNRLSCTLSINTRTPMSKVKTESMKNYWYSSKTALACLLACLRDSVSSRQRLRTNNTHILSTIANSTTLRICLHILLPHSKALRVETTSIGTIARHAENPEVSGIRRRVVSFGVIDDVQ